MEAVFNDWDDSAFKRAMAEDKPILLTIGAAWCYHCRKMDAETYVRSEIASFIKNNFIPLRVDSDKRPDINIRYNQGGWPSTVFLQPDGEVLTGATFLSPDDFLTLAYQVLNIYRELVIKGRISSILNASGGKRILKNSLSGEVKKSLFAVDSVNFIEKFYKEIKEKFDPYYGGFGTGPKFPNIDALRFCLRRYDKTKDRFLLNVITKSLDGMSEGGIFDHIDGGFFRFSPDRKFETPCYEKLLRDNLRLASLYFEAGRVLYKRSYEEVSQKILRYLKEKLFEYPFYYSSADPNEDYYRILSKEGRVKVLQPSINKTIFTDLNGLAVSTLVSLGEPVDLGVFKEIFKNLRDGDGLFYHARDTGLLTVRFLTDQTYLLQGLVTAFPEERQVSSDLIRDIMVNFYDEENGGFFDRKREEREQGLLKRRCKLLEENLILIRLLKKFGFVDRAEKSLIEIFNLYSSPVLSNAPLAVYLSGELMPA